MPQHVCVSMPSGTEEDRPPEADKTAAMAVYFKMCSMFIVRLWGCTTMLRWVPLRARLSLFVLVCVCMCILPCLCLYIPRVNRVASSCPWISIDRECGICWVFLSISLCERAGGGFVGYNKVTQQQATLRRYLWPLWTNAEIWVSVLQRHSVRGTARGQHWENWGYCKLSHVKNLWKQKDPDRV